MEIETIIATGFSYSPEPFHAPTKETGVFVMYSANSSGKLSLFLLMLFLIILMAGRYEYICFIFFTIQ